MSDTLLENWLHYSRPKKIQILGVFALCFYVACACVAVLFAVQGPSEATRSIPETVIFMEMPMGMMALRLLSLRSDVNVAVIVLCVNSWNTNMMAAMDGARRFVKLLQKEGWTATPSIYYGNSLALADIDFNAKVAYTPAVANVTACSRRKVIHEGLLFDVDWGFNTTYRHLSDVQIFAEEPAFFAEPLEAHLKEGTTNFLVFGPSTDAAWFLLNYPEVRRKVEGIFVAGGGIEKGDAGGFIVGNNVSEINFVLDPEAAEYIVGGDHGRPVTLVPLDASFKWEGKLYNELIARFMRDDKLGFDSGSLSAVATSMFTFSSDRFSRDLLGSLLAALYFADVRVQIGATVKLLSFEVDTSSDLLVTGALLSKGNTFAVSTVLGVNKKQLSAVMVNEYKCLNPC